MCVLTFQIGAIYLWSYVYNIVRLSATSSRITYPPTDGSVKDTSAVTNGVGSEPLLSSKEFLDPEQELPSPCTVPEVRLVLYSFFIAYFLCVAVLLST